MNFACCRIPLGSLNTFARKITKICSIWSGNEGLAFLDSQQQQRWGQAPPGVAVGGRLPDPPKSALPAKPTPRLADGHPDLGNGKGAWNPRIIANIVNGTGPGRGLQAIAGGEDRRRSVPTVVPESLRGARGESFEGRSRGLMLLPPGVPRMMATPFPFSDLPTGRLRVIFVFEGGAHVWRIIYTDGHGHPKDPNPFLPRRFDRPLGRRHFGGGRHRVQRRDLAGPGRSSAYRLPARGLSGIRAPMR